MGGTLDDEDVAEALPVGPAAGIWIQFRHGGCHGSAPRNCVDDANKARAIFMTPPRVVEDESDLTSRDRDRRGLRVAAISRGTHDPREHGLV